MSTLLVDAGNTALKWALARDDEPRWLAAGSQLLQGDWARQWAGALSGVVREGAAIRAAAGCSVAADEVMRRAEATAAACVGAPLQWLRAEERFEAGGVALVNGYREPAQLGADRWYAMIAARLRFADEPLVVVCAGTATTVDWVDAGGRFLGGVIAPGVAMMLGSLARGTARLPASAGRAVPAPDNTDDAIATGAADATAGLVERRVRALAARGTPPQVVLAGGRARELAARLQLGEAASGVEIDESLVLRGLWHRAVQGAGVAASANAAAVAGSAPP